MPNRSLTTVCAPTALPKEEISFHSTPQGTNPSHQVIGRNGGALGSNGRR